MYKIGIIGDKDVVIGFKAMGVDIFTITEKNEVREKLKELVEKKYTIIFILEKIAKEVANVIEYYNKNNENVSIVPIPDHNGSIGFGMEAVRKSVERAVGSSVFFNEEKK